MPMGPLASWFMDHFFQIRISGLPPESPMLEAYATLAFMVAIPVRSAWARP